MSTTQLGFCSISAMDRPLVGGGGARRSRTGSTASRRRRAPPHVDPAAPLEIASRDGARRRRDGRARSSPTARTSGAPTSAARPRPRQKPPRAKLRIAEALGAPLLRVWAEPLARRARAAASPRSRRCCARPATRRRRAGIDVVVERHIGSFADTPERIERLFASRRPSELRAQLPGARPAAAGARRRAAGRRAPAGSARALLPPEERAARRRRRRARCRRAASLAGGVLDYRAILAAPPSRPATRARSRSSSSPGSRARSRRSSPTTSRWLRADARRARARVSARWPRVASLRTPAALRARLAALGLALPCDDAVATGADGAARARRSISAGRRAARRTEPLRDPADGGLGRHATTACPAPLTERRWRRFGASGAGWIWGGEAAAVRADGRANPNQLVIDEQTACPRSPRCARRCSTRRARAGHARAGGRPAAHAQRALVDARAGRAAAAHRLPPSDPRPRASGSPTTRPCSTDARGRRADRRLRAARPPARSAPASTSST